MIEFKLELGHRQATIKAQDVTDLSKAVHVDECPWAKLKLKLVVVDKDINKLNYGELMTRLNHDS